MLELSVALVCLLATSVALTWVFPILLRPFFWGIVHGLYRVSINHRERVRIDGGGLIVSNHTSYIDWLILWIASPRRTMFVLWDVYYRNPILRFFLSWGRHSTIRIDSRTNRPHALLDGLTQISKVLDAGQLVVIFPEGELTRSGNMLPFGRGIERVLKMTVSEVSVIPTAIQGLWG
jgi:acyl-[acyl-carrier-protein]-phospholipid O-acyltransferase/long-chain-fatty-acid--[acyl-carrier-protein] ligase